MKQGACWSLEDASDLIGTLWKQVLTSRRLSESQLQVPEKYTSMRHSSMRHQSIVVLGFLAVSFASLARAQANQNSLREVAANVKDTRGPVDRFFDLSVGSAVQDASAHPTWPGPGQLFVGTCYQPVDRSPDQIDQDIAIMKRAGFNVVRMGDLSWDSFEPSQGKFTFEWFDKVMDKMQAAGIRVILDIPGSPAPIWLHRAYPGVDLVTQNGTRLPPAERYMDDISDPGYVRELGIMAEALTKRYAHHPAVIAVGYNNEIGNGFMSYSEADRQRFIVWLKKKYGTIEELNKAWATQRWSRRLSSFDNVDLPLADGPGPSERYLDLHRYWSDITVTRLMELDAIRQRNMPTVPSISNLWDTASRRGFDYLATYKSYVSYGAEGFYPGDPIGGAFGALTIKGELATPIWFNEFTAGGGGYYGTPGRSRMYG